MDAANLILKRFSQMSPVDFIFYGLIFFTSALGLAHLLLLCFKVVVCLYRAKFRKPHSLTKRYGTGWAVVTGATDGIGKAISWQLAKRGFNVLLISRTRAKLDETKEELAKEFPTVQISTLQVDYSNFDSSKQQEVTQRLEKLSEGGLAILVNNVGISYDYPMYFHELDPKRVSDMIKLNIDSTTEMTRIALTIMKERKSASRKNGAIINIGSAAGITSNPLLTQYSAAKAYVQKFSEGLACEYGPMGIDIQVHIPFFIVSKLSKFKKPSFFVPTAEYYAKLTCDRIGYEVVVNPYLPHTLFGFIIESLPTTLREVYTRNMHIGIRAKAKKKLERESGEKKD